MPTVIERAALYDISRFSRQFLHEQDVQDFRIVEHSDALDVILKTGAVGNPAASSARVTVEAVSSSVTVTVEETFAVGACRPRASTRESTTLDVEGDQITGLLAWLRLSIAGWLDAARTR